MNAHEDISRNRSPWLRAEAWMAVTQAWILLHLIGAPPPFGTVLAVLGTSLLPAFNLGLILSGCRPLHALTFGLCLSPPAAGLAGALTCGLRLDADWAALLPALLTMPLAGLAALKPVPREAGAGDRGLAMALGAGALLAALTAILLLSSPMLRLSMHGLLHASIVYRILDAGMPPENPFFAGEPLIYYWFYHLAAGGLSATSAISPLFSLAVLNILATAAVFPCLYLAGRAIELKPGCALLGSAIGMLALNPLGPLFFFLQEPDLSFGDIEGGLFPGYLVRFMALGFDLRLAAPLTKFWNISSFPVSIPLFLLGFAAGMDEGRAALRSLATMAIAAAALLLLNPITGICFFLPMGLAITAWIRKGGRARFFTILGALALAAAACLPYLLSIAAESGGEALARFSFNIVHVMGVALAAGPVLVFAAFGSARCFRQGGRAGTGLVLFSLGLLLMALCLSFPEGNEYKIIRLLVLSAGILAAGPAADFLVRLRLPKGIPALLVALALLPNSILAASAYLLTMKVELPLNDRALQIERLPPENELREAYRILREETPENSVVVVNPADHERAMGGRFQGDEAPSFARRPVYTAHEFYLTERCPGFDERLGRAENLFSGGTGPLPEPLDGRPLFVLVRGEAVPPALESPRYEEVYRGGTCALFRMKPERGP